MSATEPVVLITGASSGFGRVTAALLSARGMRVYGTSRQPVEGPLPYAMVRMDVGDDASVRTAIDGIVADAGRIDVAINNAGIAVSGSVEDTSIEEARLQLETNFLGTVRVIQTVLPHMRERRTGTIINVSSLAGLVGMPFQALYSASKFAVEGLTEGLRLELAPFGVHVVLIEPGDFRTEMTAHRIVARRAEGGAYAAQFRRTLAVYVDGETGGADPMLFARTVERIIAAPSPRVRYLIGSRAQRLAAMSKRVVSARLFERLMKAFCRVLP
jgi:NAD(P)-dependent dehydrogenase (short-subunit alcohol dehydrogenase family)